MLNAVWYRNDLRVTDHPPLVRAVEDGIVVPIYIVDPEHWSRPTASGRQWRFIARALNALRANLAVLGAPLVLRVGDTVDVLEKLRTASRDLVLWSHDGGADSRNSACDRRVELWADENAILWKRSPSGHGTRRDRGSTGYFRASALSAPEVMLAHGITPGKIVSERILYLDDDPCADAPASPIHAQRLLDHLTGADDIEDVLARLSPHLTYGTISFREAWQRVASVSGLPSAHQAALQSALVERLDLQNRSGAAAPAATCPRRGRDEDRMDLLRKGTTGWPIVDAAMRCLTATGLLRRDLLGLCGRASGILGLDVEAVRTMLGFLIVDYIPAVHGTLIATEWTRALEGDVLPNPNALGQRIDPHGSFVREWLPELSTLGAVSIHAPTRAERNSVGYIEPIIRWPG